MQKTRLIQNLAILHEGASRGPHLRKIHVDLVKCQHFSLFTFTVSRDQGYRDHNPLDTEAFLNAANSGLNEVFAVAGLTGTPFRHMLMNATYRTDATSRGVLGFAVSGRAGDRVAAMMDNQAAEITTAVQQVSASESRRLERVRAEKDTSLCVW